jgi:glyoxylase-like metal-dependent hydrolase (beta-lactamase superfamily II)
MVADNSGASLTIGDTTVTIIVEQPLHGLNHLIPLATPDAVRAIDWLAPDFIDAHGTMIGVIQAFVVEHDGAVIVVDTCIGDGKDLPTEPAWTDLTTGFLDRFRASGFDPDRVDVVLCTHLHLDHVGWNTRHDGAKWVPTFANARYLFDRTEYEYWQEESRTFDAHVVPVGERAQRAFDWGQTQVNVQRESIMPIVEAGLADLVDAPHELLPGLRLIPTPGHTPGHVSIEIVSGEQRAVITGDSFHHPCQIARPEWSTRVDFDRDASVATRRSMLHELETSAGFMIGSHFAPPGHGRIVRTPIGYRLDPSNG